MTATAERAASAAELPRQSQRLFRWFRWYAARYVGKHFHALRLSRTSHPVPADGSPLVFVMNHPSWWDILVGLCLCRRFPNYQHFAPIDAAVLPRYCFFRRLGFRTVAVSEFPQKIARDCASCDRRTNCIEIAVTREVTDESIRSGRA